MTDIDKLNYLKKYIRSFGVQIRIHQNKRRKDPFPNGVSFRTERKIVIYCQEIARCPNLVAALLIHEFGHYLLDWVHYKSDHTEREAWDIGKKNVPENCIPTNFRGFMHYCLDSYGELE